MRKSLLYMIVKNTPCVFLILLLIASTTTSAGAQGSLPYISLDPTSVTDIEPGQSFTLNVTITNVTDMLGFEFKLWYNKSVINPVNVTPGSVVPPGAIVGPVGPAPWYAWSPHNCSACVTKGYVWCVAAWLGAFTGNGTLMTINFTATTIGNSTLHINATSVGDSLGEPIEHTVEPPGLVQGTVEVIPEFPATLVMPLLLIATLAATILGKMFWSRKRKDALVAK